MKKLKLVLMAFVMLFAASVAHADTASYTTLTVAQEDYLNQVGSPTAVDSSYHVRLGTLLDQLIDPSFTLSPTADSATTNQVLDVNLTTPVDTTGTNTHEALNVDLTIGNATGGTNTVAGYDLSAVTGDAQVNVRGFRTGTGTTLGTSYAFEAGSGWDRGFYSASANEVALSPGADSATTNVATIVGITTPVDTTGSNTHMGINVVPTIGNASGGTNTMVGVKIASMTGDAEVVERGVDIGAGYDMGLVVSSPVNFGDAGTFSLPAGTIANRPASGAKSGSVYAVTNAADAVGCGGGTGSTFNICVSDGTNWVDLT